MHPGGLREEVRGSLMPDRENVQVTYEADSQKVPVRNEEGRVMKKDSISIFAGEMITMNREAGKIFPNPPLQKRMAGVYYFQLEILNKLHTLHRQ